VVYQHDLFEAESDVARSLLSDLLEQSQLYKSSTDYKELLDFIVRMRNIAPFNAMLIQIQKPGLMYAASAQDWNMRFRRTIKEGARPLLILWAFGPVALVYDIEDTEGNDPLPEDIAQTFRATGIITSTKIQEFIHPLSLRGIEIKLIEYGEGKAGHVQAIHRSSDVKKKPIYRIRLNKKHDPNVQFATLIHELGHLFLGHLGPDKYLKIHERPAMTNHQQELEAESLSYLVCAREGVQSKSESYLKDYVQTNETIEDLDIYRILTAARMIETTLRLAVHMDFGQAKSI